GSSPARLAWRPTAPAASARPAAGWRRSQQPATERSPRRSRGGSHGAQGSSAQEHLVCLAVTDRPAHALDDETGLAEQPEPRGPREQAEFVAVVNGPHVAVLAQQQRVLGAPLAVARHRIPGPFEVAQRPVPGVALVQRRALDARDRAN